MSTALCRLYTVLLILQVLTIQSYAQTQGWRYYHEEFSGANNSIEIITPGFFSIHLSKTLKNLSSKGVHIRILLDSSNLDDPTNSIGTLKDNISVRILEESRLIPLTLIIIDRTRVLMGGDHFNDSEQSNFRPLKISDPKTVKSYVDQLQKLWSEGDPVYTLKVLRAIEFDAEIDTISTRQIDVGYPRSTQSTGNFVASVHSKIYHRANSRSAKKIKPQNRIYFKSESEARKSNRSRAKNF
jgi:hypothetical protein